MHLKTFSANVAAILSQPKCVNSLASSSDTIIVAWNLVNNLNIDSGNGILSDSI